METKETTIRNEPRPGRGLAAEGIFGIFKIIAKETLPEPIVEGIELGMHYVPKDDGDEEDSLAELLRKKSEEKDKKDIIKLRRELIDLQTQGTTKVNLEGKTRRQIIE